MSELDLHSIGFECKKTYEHGEFHTNRYIKGVMEVEFTYLGSIGTDGELQDISLSLTETDFENVSFEEVVVLNKILNKKS